MGATEAILSLNPAVYVPLQDATGTTTPYVLPSSVTSAVVGSPAPTQSGPAGDAAWSVNGAGGSYMTIAATSGSQWAGANFTVMACVYLNTIVSFATAIGKAPNSGGTTHEYLLRLNGTTGWQMWFSQQGSGNGYSTSQGGSVATGTWTWLMGTFAASTTTTALCVDGVQVHSTTTTTGSPSGGIAVAPRLGDYQGTGINGRLAHVAFWNSTLTPANALMVYTASLRNKVSY